MRAAWRLSPRTSPVPGLCRSGVCRTLPIDRAIRYAREIGEANFTCVTFSGTGYGAAVGQTFENAVNIDWPRIDSLASYTRTINWETGTSQETFDREPGLSPVCSIRANGSPGDPNRATSSTPLRHSSACPASTAP